ncbi:MAG: hypothetical protein K2J58_07370 [Muribaculaceae bacterium]|nr:hypothetical protein [Muribaculaceae bacterium]
MKTEENKDIIYDLEDPSSAPQKMESSEVGDEGGECMSEGAEDAQGSETSENPYDNADNAEHGDNVADSGNPAMAEITRMVEEMGAETLLDIIRDNRNAAIRRIISEVEASGDRIMPSGASSSMGCASIFDLAALA